MEIDKFTIIEQNNMTIACAVLYPFPDEQIMEMVCVVMYPDYSSSVQTRRMALKKLFVLTNRSIHWFQAQLYSGRSRYTAELEKVAV